LRKRSIAVIAILFGCMFSLQGHALLKGVTPQAGTTVDGREVAFALDFNTRIDGVRSRLELLTPEKKTVVLQIEPQISPGSLRARAHDLRSGAYTLRWQALAIDGHITRGEVPFAVK
jgi:methionine-rich copper-binding protein CopC